MSGTNHTQGSDHLYFHASAADFKKMPGSPIAYWVSKQVLNIFEDGIALKEVGDTRQGMATSDNDRFLRTWQEVSFNKSFSSSKTRNDAKDSGKKWFPYNKGGEFRKWYGNAEYFVNWENDGEELLGYAASLYGSPTRTIKSISEYFKESISWSKVSSANLAMRYYPSGYIFDVAGCCIFSDNSSDLMFLLSYTNSTVVRNLLASISPTINFEAGQIASLPVLDNHKIDFIKLSEELVRSAKIDWDSYETSWDFSNLPLLHHDYRQSILKRGYKKLRNHWKKISHQIQKLEEENNHLFINAYGLQDELTPNVPPEEITLTCNPHYRYSGGKSEEELEALLLQDTMREFCSYAVGCMFGRYSLDKPGLVLANQGETLEDYLAQVPEPTFRPDEDNVIPMLDGDWFPDDVTERFCDFLRVTFGKEHYEENLAFVEHGLNIKGKRNYSVRDFFVKEFYDYHVKLYKKRPIYWLFASPKGTFQALVYLHRYRSDTVSVVLGYLRDFRTKLEARQGQLQRRVIDPDISQGEKNRMDKELDKLGKQLLELNDYERDVLHPLASQRLEIDLDDGVKANYPKFGAALKKISGLEAKGD